MICPKCKRELPEDAKFCGKCGTIVTGALVVSSNTDVAVFNPTKKLTYISIDENHRQFAKMKGFSMNKIGAVYNIDDIIEYELMEDGASVTKGGLGAAVAGGLLFGGVGAVVGAVTGGKKSKKIISSLRIKLTMRSLDNPAVYIDIISTKTKSDSTTYRHAYDTAQEILSALAVLTEKKDSAIKHEGGGNTADHLMKLKVLLDEGILTQEEFDGEKAKILKAS